MLRTVAAISHLLRETYTSEMLLALNGRRRSDDGNRTILDVVQIPPIGYPYG